MSPSSVGIWLVGARGGVAATATVGLIGLQKQLTRAVGLVSELPYFAGLDLAAWPNFVVGGHEIRGELEAGEAQTERSRQCFGERGLPDAGDVLHQEMSARDQTGEGELDLRALAGEHLGQCLGDADQGRLGCGGGKRRGKGNDGRVHAGLYTSNDPPGFRSPGTGGPRGPRGGSDVGRPPAPPGVREEAGRGSEALISGPSLSYCAAFQTGPPCKARGWKPGIFDRDEGRRS